MICAYAFDYDSLTIYPYMFRTFVIIVPNYQKQQTTNLLWSILNSSLVNVWSLAILLFSIMRIIIIKHTMRAYNSDFIGILLNTYGIAFITTGFSGKLKNASEYVLLIFLSLFAILASTLFSGFMYQSYVDDFNVPAINSLKDLNKTDLNIVMPILTFNDKWVSSHLR